MKGYRCDGNCLGDIEDKPIETNERLWSNVSSWDNGRLPLEGETVEIKSGWNMILDIAETPIVDMLYINGRLTFKNGMDINLRAKHIFVRAGELLIGTPEEPFTHKAIITLHGEKENEHIVYTNAIEAGNKLLANTGVFKAYGLPRLNKMTRLTKTA